MCGRVSVSKLCGDELCVRCVCVRVCMFMRFFTSQRPGLWISIVSCFFRVFFCVPFS